MKRVALLTVFVAVLIGFLVAVQASLAVAWEPKEAIEFIAPANPGGGWDTICRTSARVLQKTALIKQPAYVANMPGGSGSVAIAYVVKKRRGDNNLLVAASNALTFSMAIKRTPYTYDDITPLAQVASEFGGYVVRADSKFKTLADLVKALKADPKSVTFAGGSAPGGMDHIKVALLAKEIGVDPLKISYVPYQGGGEALASLLGGHVEVGSLDLSEVAGQLEAGKVRVLAVLSENRLKAFPDLATAREQGVDVVFNIWRGLYMAPGVSKEAKEFWVATIKKMVATPEWNSERQKLGWEPVVKFGDDFASFVKDEYQRYKTLLKELGFVK
ncbi:MAG: tripartite tricarboxylate transporter substrate binding protein [Deltaproteobacteria bacterium]|nr:tripartite tricarboxylate transporter substrate binding protein [Deltaproteobacteria bacterium]MBW2070074.1 tripartite tricarboxylate transporter substrate binding protein [Deltaproteobacteria bacterium]